MTFQLRCRTGTALTALTLAFVPVVAGVAGATPDDTSIEPSRPANVVDPHGEGTQYWAAILAGSWSPDAPELSAAISSAAAVGYPDAYVAPCDDGALQALDSPPGPAGSTFFYTVSVYFESAQAATRAEALFEAHGVPAVTAQVRVFCRDY